MEPVQVYETNMNLSHYIKGVAKAFSNASNFYLESTHLNFRNQVDHIPQSQWLTDLGLGAYNLGNFSGPLRESSTNLKGS